METDPICGMDVDPSTAAGAWPHDGVTYYFCSPACLERFKADPAAALAVPPGDRTMNPGTGG
ncbi:MAG: YHS domain-containing protein [Actinomycetota bacterium]